VSIHDDASTSAVSHLCPLRPGAVTNPSSAKVAVAHAHASQRWCHPTKLHRTREEAAFGVSTRARVHMVDRVALVARQVRSGLARRVRARTSRSKATVCSSRYYARIYVILRMVSELHHTSTEPTRADMATEPIPNPFDVYLSPTKTKPDLLFSQTKLNRTLIRGLEPFTEPVPSNGLTSK
jgi:hypothetical protein